MGKRNLWIVTPVEEEDTHIDCARAFGMRKKLGAPSVEIVTDLDTEEGSVPAKGEVNSRHSHQRAKAKAKTAKARVRARAKTVKAKDRDTPADTFRARDREYHR